MSYDLIIFDCDGTLVDTEQSNLKAMVDIMHEYGLNQYSLDVFRSRFSGMKFSAIIDAIKEETQTEFPDNISDQYISHSKTLTLKESKPIAYVHDAVKTAKKHAAIAVVSNGERNKVLFSLQNADLKDYFDEELIFTGLMAPNPKPAPDLFLLAVDKLGTSPEKTLVIEDSVTGVLGAKAAKMDVWGFYGTHHDPDTQKQDLKENGALKVFETMKEINQALLGEFQ